jgi:glycosyltransferase involved in cell wall biosynthesis
MGNHKIDCGSRGRRVLLVTLRSDEGGGPKLVSELALNLGADEAFSIFSASPLDPPYGPQLRRCSVQHLELSHRRWTLLTLFKLKMFCRREKIDVVHSHGFGALLYSGCLALLGENVVHQPHGTHLPLNFRSRVKAVCERLLCRGVDQLLFVSESEKENAKKLKIHAKSFGVVPNPLINAPNDLFAGLRRKNLSTAGPFVFGNLSRLDPIKRHVELIRLFSLHPDVHHRKLRLRIMGDGELKGTVLNEIERNRAPAELLSFSSKPFSFLVELDAYISASKSEGFGLSVIEALACGLPCLISEVPGHVDFINRGWAIGFSVESPLSFQTGVELILSGKWQGPDPAEIAREFSSEVWLAKLKKVYQRY